MHIFVFAVGVIIVFLEPIKVFEKLSANFLLVISFEFDEFGLRSPKLLDQECINAHDLFVLYGQFEDHLLLVPHFLRANY